MIFKNERVSWLVVVVFLICVLVYSIYCPFVSAQSAPDTSAQFNDGGSFGGDADFTWDKITKTLFLGASGGQAQLTLSGDYGIIQGGDISGFQGGLFIRTQDQTQTDSSGSNVVIGTANGNGTGDAGGFQVNAGQGGATSGSGGLISLTAGSAQGGDSDGGSISLTLGQASGGGLVGSLYILGDPSLLSCSSLATDGDGKLICGLGGGGGATSTSVYVVDNPTLDFFMGVLCFWISVFFFTWIWRRK